MEDRDLSVIMDIKHTRDEIIAERKKIRRNIAVYNFLGGEILRQTDTQLIVESGVAAMCVETRRLPVDIPAEWQEKGISQGSLMADAMVARESGSGEEGVFKIQESTPIRLMLCLEGDEGASEHTIALLNSPPEDGSTMGLHNRSRVPFSHSEQEWVVATIEEAFDTKF